MQDALNLVHQGLKTGNMQQLRCGQTLAIRSQAG
jgi:hypothetical protein